MCRSYPFRSGRVAEASQRECPNAPGRGQFGKRIFLGPRFGPSGITAMSARCSGKARTAMGDEEPNSGRARRRMVELLAGYLLAAPVFLCPGADGATVEDVLEAEYPVASAAGRVPRPGELATRHPDLADALASFFGAGAISAEMAG